MPRRGDQQHNFPSVPEQLTRAGRIGIRLVRAADQTGTLRDIVFDPNEFRCARLAGELADEWVDYAETSAISRDWVSHGRRAIRNFCTTADLLLGKNAHRASLARQHPDIATVVAEWERTLPTGFRAGSPTPAAYAGSVRALIARRAQHDQRPVTAALCRLVDGVKGVPLRQQPGARRVHPRRQTRPCPRGMGVGRISWMSGSRTDGHPPTGDATPPSTAGSTSPTYFGVWPLNKSPQSTSAPTSPRFSGGHRSCGPASTRLIGPSIHDWRK